MSDVCRNVRSSQAPSRANAPWAFNDRVRDALSRPALALYSSSVSSARPANWAGRAIGIACAESPDQTPCRSGSPHGVFGVLRALAGALLAAAGVRSWPAAEGATSDSATSTPAAVHTVF